MTPTILHIDMNKFYASVEQMLNPQLKNKAIAVCGSTEERHGIVLTASAEAKARGVKTGMANWEARRACPGLIVVPPQYDQYCKYPKLARAIYGRYSDRIEPFGMDECWVDISPICRTFDDAEKIAHEIRTSIKEELGLTVSIGVSFSKVLAKLGSDMKKPDAVTVLSPENWEERVWPLPVSELLYVGHSTTRKLMSRGILTIGDLAHYPYECVRQMLGKNGTALWRYANGLDRSPVMPVNYERGVKSVSHGITCRQNLETPEQVWKVMLELAQDVGHQLRGYGLAATGVRVYIRESDINYGLAKQSRVSFPTQSPLEIAQAARILFMENYQWNNPVRAVCVSTFGLVPRDSAVQLNLFVDETRRMRRQKLDDCIDEIRGRFGKHSIIAASLMGDLYMPDDGRHEVKMPGIMFT
mgnify:FL=1